MLIAGIAYYANVPLLWRNVIMIGIANLGWSMVFTIVGPLMTLKLLDLGVRENIQATITSVNGWALSFLVMWFSWMSDHTVTRIGRRKPYLFLAAPFIIADFLVRFRYHRERLSALGVNTHPRP